MKSPTARRFALLGLAFFALALSSHGQETKKPYDYKGQWEEVGPNVRIMRHQDGGKTEYRRSPDERTLTKKTRNPNGVIKMTAVYRMDSAGNPRGCEISDGKGNTLYKVSYGYSKKTGRLLAEQMFDARANFLGKDGKPAPVRILRYQYDAQGNRSKAISVSPQTGKTLKDAYGETTYPHENPFKR